MQVTRTRGSVAVRILARATLAVLMGSGACAASAATGASASQIQAQYERERAVCLSGRSNQDQATCLKEAGAARDVARRGLLESEGNPDYRRNQLERCKALSGEEAKDCRLRMKGAGVVSGSASAGGIYRELRTVEPAPAASAASAP
jgi:hypothetical protein